MTYTRPLLTSLRARFQEPRRFIQLLVGPRQVGKTTLARQLIEELSIPHHFASADEPSLKGRGWIAEQWEIGRLRTQSKDGEERRPALLVIDEVQKLSGWSDVIKRLWDEDSATGTPLHLLLLGSAPLLLRRGMAESLAGRFEIHHATHWSYPEMRDAFGWDLDRYIYFGGYPGAAVLIDDEERWKRYILDSLIETTIARDVLLMARVDKPALLRRLFHVACEYSGQVLAYQKMVGQLQDAGNTTTLANYLDLLGGAGMVTGLGKYAGAAVRRRASSPKLQVYNTALISAQTRGNFQQAREKPEWWGRLCESAVGAHLLNSILGTSYELYYWRERDREVDFVLTDADEILAVEVKSGKHSEQLPGIDTFLKMYQQTRPMLVGKGGLPLEEFLSLSPRQLFTTSIPR